MNLAKMRVEEDTWNLKRFSGLKSKKTLVDSTQLVNFVVVAGLTRRTQVSAFGEVEENCQLIRW